jgi:hypothetical protein
MQSGCLWSQDMFHTLKLLGFISVLVYTSVYTGLFCDEY